MGYQMKSYKKFVATAASATLVASAIVPVASASFTDVEETHEFATYINAAVEAGYVKGYENGTFGINDKLKRSHVVLIIGRYLEKLGYTSEATTSPWSDVTSEEVIKYGNIVKDAGVFKGFADGTLKGNDFITRENMAVVLDRVAKTVTGTSLSEVAADIEDVEIADLATANADYQASIQALRDLEISTAKNFNPKGDVKRGQFAKFIVTTVETIDSIEVAPEVTAEDIKKEIEAVDATLPAVKDITADNAEAAKVAVEAAKTAIAAIKEKIQVTGLTGEEVAELNKAIEAVEAKFALIVEAADKAVEAAKQLAVESVSAINAKELKVTFSKPIKSSTVISNSTTGELVSSVFSVAGLTTNSVPASPITAGNLTGSLSADGKVLTLTAGVGESFAGRYDFTIAADKIEDLEGNKLGNLAQVITVSDTSKPSLVNVEYPNNITAVLNFSEIIDTATASITAKYADGTPIALADLGLDSLKGESKTITVNLSSVQANKDVLITFVGIEDVVGNISTPNPITVTVKKDDSDKVAPKVTSITPTSLTSFTIKFDEPVVKKAGFADTDIKIGNPAVDVGTKSTVDAKDATLVHVTGITPVNGIQSITIAADAFEDKSGNKLAAHTQLVNFVADTVKPTVASTEVKTINNAKFLIVNFSEDVTLGTGNATFTTKKSNGETDVVTVAHDSMSAYNVVDGKTKSIQIPLATLTAGATYTLELDKDLVSDNFGNTNAVVKDITVAVPGVAQAQEMLGDSLNISVISPNVLAVKFKHELDVASAETASNYTVEGATVKKAEIHKNNSVDGYIVYLTLEKNTVELDGPYEVTVKNVKANNGLALEKTYVENVTLKENVVPTVQGAKYVTANGNVTGIELTFSEVVKASTTDLNIFQVFVGGSTTAVSTANADLFSNTTNKVTLTVTLTPAQIAEGITVKLNPSPTNSTTKIVDLKGNALDFTEIKAGF